MIKNILFATIAVAASNLSHAASLYKWVDETGATQYTQAAPPAPVKHVEKLFLSSPPPMETTPQAATPQATTASANILLPSGQSRNNQQALQQANHAQPDDTPQDAYPYAVVTAVDSDYTEPASADGVAAYGYDTASAYDEASAAADAANRRAEAATKAAADATNAAASAINSYNGR